MMMQELPQLIYQKRVNILKFLNVSYEEFKEEVQEEDEGSKVNQEFQIEEL